AATTSAELAGVLSDEQGSGALVFATSPTFTTPVLGAATATSIAIGANTLNTSEWANLDGVNQTLATTSTPQFARLGLGVAADGTALLSLTGQAAIQVNPFNTGAGQTSELRFLELAANGTNYVGFKSPDAITDNKIWTLPNADGSANQALLTNGSGVLSWGAAGVNDATFVTLSTHASLSAERTLVGTSNQITVTDNGAGSTLVLSTPQNLNTGASPTFATLTLSTSLLPSASPTAGASSQTITSVITTNDVGKYASMAIGTDGLPIIAFYDATDKDLKVVHCGNAACSSGNTTTTLATTNDSGAYSTITVVSDGLPLVFYVEYDEVSARLIKVIKCGNTACSSGNTTVNSGVAPSSTAGLFAGTKSDGFGFVLYHPNGGGAQKILYCGDVGCTAGNMNTANVDATGSDRGTYNSAALGPHGLLVTVTYEPNGAVGDNLIVERCGTVNCGSVTRSEPDTVGNVGQYNSIAFVPSDSMPIISHYNVTNGDLHVVKCANLGCTTGSTITAVDSTNDVGKYTSIGITSDGFALVSFYDVTNGNLRILKCGNTACSTGNTVTAVDTGGDVGQYTSLKIGADGLPIVAYYDVTNGDLKTIKCANIACSQTAGGSYTGGSNVGSIGAFFNNIYGAAYWGRQFQIAAFDLAEEYEALDSSIEPGDVVCLGQRSESTNDHPNDTNKSGLVKCSPNGKPVLGIVSTKPAIVLG
ncbi:hypothetical protein HY629_02325, partial [Candidatus Uhrbacteria bacterium]|nr:hypothetical protein [Candidatus Uhrbacteria bacterium]